MRCGFEWEGKRLLLDDGGNPHRFKDEPLRGGMTECWAWPKCKSIYVEWVNWVEILGALGRYWER
mgnify:FL=1